MLWPCLPAMGRRIVGLEEGPMHPFELHGALGQRELVVVQTPLHIEMRLHDVQPAFTLGAHNGDVLNRQAGAHRFELVGDIRPTAVRQEPLWGTVLATGGIEHEHRYPTRFRGRHRRGQHRAGVAIEEDNAPPFAVVLYK